MHKCDSIEEKERKKKERIKNEEKNDENTKKSFFAFMLLNVHGGEMAY